MKKQDAGNLIFTPFASIAVEKDFQTHPEVKRTRFFEAGPGSGNQGPGGGGGGSPEARGEFFDTSGDLHNGRQAHP
ncbi:MAG: hypothetical protein LBK99_10000, partial [Opitutaceae bacterium]|nr:hypothetical protein [Opitutaceae bacterium]